MYLSTTPEAFEPHTLEARQFGYRCPAGTYRRGNNCYRNRSTWNSWARWLVLGLIILFFLILFVGCSCLSARRRRRAGRNPFYGTGWAAGKTAPGHGQPQYNNTQAYYNNNADQTSQAPPVYPAGQGYYGQPPQNGGYYGNQNQTGANNSYYGQQNGVELQSPQPTYNNGARGDDSGYAPPAGPPPGKDGVIR